MARIDCHFREDGSYITLPDEWLGIHVERHDQAISSLEGRGIPATIHNFTVAMSLLEDWSLPGMPANPDGWDTNAVPIAVMVWVWETVRESYYKSFVIPKKKSVDSSNGQPVMELMESDGALNETL